MPPGDSALVVRASELYARIAAQRPLRFLVIDRTGRTQKEVIDQMRAACLARIEDRCVT